jgi:hypothetical protein
MDVSARGMTKLRILLQLLPLALECIAFVFGVLPDAGPFLPPYESKSNTEGSQTSTIPQILSITPFACHAKAFDSIESMTTIITVVQFGTSCLKSGPLLLKQAPFGPPPVLLAGCNRANLRL